MSYHPVTFGVHSRSGTGVVMILVVTWLCKTNVIKALRDFVVRSPSRYATILPNLMAIGTMAVEI